MRSILSRLILIGFSSYSCIAGAWTINADFEAGNIGARSNGTGGFSEAFSYSTLSNDAINHNGSTKSSKVGIDSGTDGWAKWGGVFTFPSQLSEGDEIWFRAYFYYPADFDFTATGQGMKTMRIHTNDGTGRASGTSQGMLDVLTTQTGISIGSEVGDSGTNTSGFYANNPRSKWADQGTMVPKGIWNSLEMYVKFSSVPGQGIYRVWQDGNLIFEDTQTYTLKSAASKADFIYLYTYWNGGAPRTQFAYVDDIVITTDTPSRVDANGNRYIGTKYISPKAPVSSTQ